MLVDWGKLSVHQVRQWHPNAVVVFIGANDGYSMPGPGGKQVNCCGAEWAAIYASRVRQMMNTYRQDGAARVYWLTLPTPRDSLRAKISLVVNAAIEVAAEPWRDQVTIIDTVPVFTPGDKYRDSMNDQRQADDRQGIGRDPPQRRRLGAGREVRAGRDRSEVHALNADAPRWRAYVSCVKV